MIPLLELAIEAHGGLERWRRVHGIDCKLRIGGSLWLLKGLPHGLVNVALHFESADRLATITPFGPEGAVLGFHYGKDIPSSTLAGSVNTDPTFVRKSLSKLSKAGLSGTTRGRNGASMLTRSPKKITLLDIYRASEGPPTFAIHSYPVERTCPVSPNIKGCMSSVLRKVQSSFEDSLDEITLADLVGQIRRASQ